MTCNKFAQCYITYMAITPTNKYNMNKSYQIEYKDSHVDFTGTLGEMKKKFKMLNPYAKGLTMKSNVNQIIVKITK